MEALNWSEKKKKKTNEEGKLLMKQLLWSSRLYLSRLGVKRIGLFSLLILNNGVS